MTNDYFIHLIKDKIHHFLLCLLSQMRSVLLASKLPSIIIIIINHNIINQGCTTCCILASGMRENGKRMRKLRGNGERMRKWIGNGEKMRKLGGSEEMEIEWGYREGGNKKKYGNVESESLSISSLSLHFLLIFSFSVHFLASRMQGCSKLCIPLWRP